MNRPFLGGVDVSVGQTFELKSDEFARKIGVFLDDLHRPEINLIITFNNRSRFTDILECSLVHLI